MTKPTKWLCAQRRLRSAWASAQSDQSLPCALNGSYEPKLSLCGLRRLGALYRMSDRTNCTECQTGHIVQNVRQDKSYRMSDRTNHTECQTGHIVQNVRQDKLYRMSDRINLTECQTGQIVQNKTQNHILIHKEPNFTRTVSARGEILHLNIFKCISGIIIGHSCPVK